MASSRLGPFGDPHLLGIGLEDEAGEVVALRDDGKGGSCGLVEGRGIGGEGGAKFGAGEK